MSTLEAFLVCVPYIPPTTGKQAHIDSSYRYCIKIRTKFDGTEILFCPTNFMTYSIPKQSLRPPVAYPKPIRPLELIEMLERRVLNHQRWNLPGEPELASALIKELRKLDE